MAEEKKGFFKRLLRDLQKPAKALPPVLTIFSAAFQKLMRIFMRN